MFLNAISLTIRTLYVNSRRLQDGMNNMWDKMDIIDHVNQYLAKNRIDTVHIF
jgi:hypothetical protein